MNKFIILLSLLFFTISVKSQSDLFRNILEDYFESESTGGTAIVTKGGEVIYRDAIGKANVELDVDMEPKHILRLGSITKQFTAVAILQLAEAGKLDLDANFSEYLPNYPLGDREVTVSQLLNHTSGIKSYTGIPGWMQTETRKRFELDSLIAEFQDLPFDFEPGDSWSYNNSGYILLGAIIEAVSGDSYEDYLQENIFDKVGLENTYYDDHRKIIPNRVPGYMPGFTGPTNTEFLDMTIPYAAGSLISNVDDLAKWNEAVFDYKLVGKETLMKAFEPAQLNNGNTHDYGFGWGLGRIQGSKVYEHGGGIHGFLTQGIYAPEEDIYVAVLSNCNCVSPSEAANRMMAVALGKNVEYVEVELSEKDLKKYVGTYKVNEEENRYIELKDGKLTSQRGMGQVMNLVPYGAGYFAYENSLTRVKFVEENGMVTGHKMLLFSGEEEYAEKISSEILTEKMYEVSPEIMAKYVGQYKLANGMELNVKIEDGKLMVAPTGQSPVQLLAFSDTKFKVPEYEVKINFKVDGEGNCTGMDFQQGEMKMDGEKIKG